MQQRSQIFLSRHPDSFVVSVSLDFGYTRLSCINSTSDLFDAALMCFSYTQIVSRLRKKKVFVFDSCITAYRRLFTVETHSYFHDPE